MIYFLMVGSALTGCFADELAHEKEYFGVAFGAIVLHDFLVFFDEVFVEVTFVLGPSLYFLSEAACVDSFLLGGT